ncbi:MAG: CehA/McbA family metallohydrolase [Thermoleophilaceae bacterium]
MAGGLRRLGLGVIVTLALPAAAAGQAPGLQEFEGPIHEHTAYSDGEPGTRPADAFAAVRGHGSDFMALTEHSDTLQLPIVTNTKCFEPQVLVTCLFSDQEDELDSLRKWDAMAEQTDAATDAGFVGIRGFEWTNDRHGHINVLFSRHNTNAKIDGGYLSMSFFWSWFTRPASQGGGADGLAIFNHPGRRELGELVPGGFISPFTPDIPLPGSDWDDFAFVPAADARMVGIELFNGGSDYGSPNDLHPAGSYGQALDRGWHVGAVGAEDTHDTGWGRPEERKTVVLAPALSRADLRDSMLARRFYAVRHAGIRMSFTVDGQEMGSRLSVAAGDPLAVEAGTPEPGATVELVTSGGEVVAGGPGSLSVSRPASAAERWYFVRVRDAEGESLAYSSPVWVEAG